MIVIAMTVADRPIASQIGTNRRAKADPKVPGALGLSPDPNPIPENTTRRSYHDMALKLIMGLCKVLISI